MDYKLPATEVVFRDALRAWLEEHCPTDWERSRQAASRETRAEALIGWQRQLYAAGYVGLHWPVSYGGRGGSVMEQAIFYEELARARAPELANAIGLDMAGPAIMVHGTEDQKHLHLPRILAAEHIFCQGFSEPGSGSDLDPAARRLWLLVREQIGGTPAVAQDERRLQAALTDRRTKSQEFFTSSAGQWDRLRAEMFGLADQRERGR